MTVLTIGKLAKACGVKADTLRYYEKLGLLLPQERLASGYRSYGGDSVEKLRFIRKAQSLGFTLEEIKKILTLPEQSEADCADVRQFAQDKIVEIEAQMADLKRVKKCLKELVTFCPGEGKPLSDCNILQHFYEGEET